MALFPQLEDQSLRELTRLFLSPVPEDVTSAEEASLWFQEIAIKIARVGNAGLAILLDVIPKADSVRLQSIVVSLAFLDEDLVIRHKDALRGFLTSSLHHPTDLIIAEAIDVFGILGFADVQEDVMPLLHHHSPYVVGSVLRFLRRHSPDVAKPLLFEALQSPNPIIRQNAVDELDELECKEALGSLLSLRNDPDKDVREAVETAVKHLGGDL